MTDLAKLVETHRKASATRVAAAQGVLVALTPEESVAVLAWFAARVEKLVGPTSSEPSHDVRSEATRKANATRAPRVVEQGKTPSSVRPPTMREIIKRVLANGAAMTSAQIRAEALKIRPDLKADSLAAEISDMRDKRAEIVDRGTAPNGNKLYALASTLLNGREVAQ